MEVSYTLKGMRSFLGLVNYYRRFIPKMAEVVEPLSELLKKGRNIRETEATERAIQKCKEILSEPPVLAYPDFTRSFIITTDASDVAMGAVMSQVGHDGQERPVEFASKKFKPAETRYSATERELLAVVWAVDHFRPYVWGRPFMVRTDHMPLKWLAKLKENTTKITRWKARLAAYDFEIHHTKGKENVVADTLSRLVANNNELSVRELDEWVNEMAPTPEPGLTEEEAYEALEHWIEEDGGPEHQQNDTEWDWLEGDETQEENRQMREEQTMINDKKHQIILEGCEGGGVVSAARKWKCLSIVTIRVGRDSDREQVKHHLGTLTAARKTFFLYTEEDNLKKSVTDWYERKVICPQGRMVWCAIKKENVEEEKRQEDIVREIHEGITNHRGTPAMVAQISRDRYWPNIRGVCMRVVAECQICNRAKYDRRGDIIPEEETPTPERPWQSVEVDVFTWEGRKYMTFIDRFSKLAGAVGIRRKTAEEIVRVITEMCSRYGCPKEIRTDRGREFENEPVRQLVAELKIHHHKTTAGHPKSRGTIERFHGTLSEHLRLLKEQGRPGDPECVSRAILAYNESIHSSTGLTPLEALIRVGEEGDRLKKVRERIELEKRQRAERRNARRKPEKFQNIQLGQTVFIKNSCRRNKEHQLFRGPWRVEAKLERQRLHLTDPLGRRSPVIVHMSEVRNQPGHRKGGANV